MYKPSKYQIYFIDSKSKYLLCYNFFTESIIAVPHKHVEIAKKMLKQPNEYINNEYFEVFESEGFIVRSHKDETFLLEQEYKNTIKESPIVISIGNTLACNFSCFYCYQKRENILFTKEMGDTLIHYINKLQDKTIYINWIGGEPLLNFDIMEYISKQLNIPFKSTLLTNAYLLHKYIDKINILNLDMIYLTLDGIPDVHNSIRFTNNDNNTFQQILNNIKVIADKFPNIKIVIKTNIDKDSNFDFSQFLLLLNDLKGKVRVNPGSILEKRENRENDEKIIDFSLNYYSDLLSNGFAVYKLPRKSISGSCSAYNSDSFAISANGLIHKCIEGIGTKNFVIGKIKKNKLILDKEKIKKYTEFNIFSNKQCVDCKLFPYCMGGCLQNQLEKYNELNKRCNIYSQNYIRAKLMISEYFNHTLKMN